MIFIVAGPTGSGKSTIGKMLADQLGWVFLEADHFHSAANKEKMGRGIPLDDADRIPWLKSIHKKLLTLNAKGKNIVLACSALKEDYRKLLSAGLDIKLIYLHGSKELIAKRLSHRTSHFAKAAILPNQFEVLEKPKNAVLVDIDQTPEQIVKEILQKIEKEPL